MSLLVGQDRHIYWKNEFEKEVAKIRGQAILRLPSHLLH